MVDFIWDGGSSKIAYDVIIQPLSELPPFYRDIQNYWSETLKVDVLNPKVVMNQTIWRN